MKHLKNRSALLEDDGTDVEAFALTFRDLEAIAPLIGRNVRSKDELLSALKRLTTISVNGAEITLEPYLIERLKSRAFNQRFDEFLHYNIRKLLEGFAQC